MTAPIPEERDEAPIGDEEPPGEHTGELPAADDGSQAAEATQVENAESSADQPSQ